MLFLVIALFGLGLVIFDKKMNNVKTKDEYTLAAKCQGILFVYKIIACDFYQYRVE